MQMQMGHEAKMLLMKKKTDLTCHKWSFVHFIKLHKFQWYYIVVFTKIDEHYGHNSLNIGVCHRFDKEVIRQIDY